MSVATKRPRTRSSLRRPLAAGPASSSASPAPPFSSDLSVTEPFGARAGRCGRSLPPLLSATEAPPSSLYPGVQGGYRGHGLSLGQCVLSCTCQSSNESINVLTHLLPGLYFAAEAASAAWDIATPPSASALDPTDVRRRFLFPHRDRVPLAQGCSRAGRRWPSSGARCCFLSVRWWSTQILQCPSTPTALQLATTLGQPPPRAGPPSHHG